MSGGAYARSGVDTERAGGALAGLVDVLSSIDTGRPSRAVLGSGHYANVLRITDELGIAISTDGVGSKVIVAEQLGRFDTVGIDCVAMNVNDLICVGADPIALVDYIAVEETDPEMLRAIAEGLKEGAEQAQVEIPGGELAMLPELIRGHPSPSGFDLVGACFGVVELDAIVTGAAIEPGDAIVGVPSSGIHSNGLTLARRVLDDLDERRDELGGRSVGEELLVPTAIYVRAVKELLASEIDVRGLAHITGDGLANLLRLEADVGYRIDSPLPVPPLFELIAQRGAIEPEEMYDVFNMGCGLCAVVLEADAHRAVELLSAHHPGSAVIGAATAEAGVVHHPALGGTTERPAEDVDQEAVNLRIIRGFYDAFARRDHESAFKHYSPDVEWDVSRFPTPGIDPVYRGHEGIRRFWRAWLGAWAELAFEVKEIRAAGPYVAVRIEQRNLGRESGIWVDQGTWTSLWTLRDGLVIRQEFFDDYDEALRAAGITP